ncbi:MULTISPECIES: terpene synthase family protein [unclassified Streptomyces]|uniref:terpene synthase family protein n=1 Tax=unclassified Streptomyces TaxID=2593676 RepID=UPI00332851FC
MDVGLARTPQEQACIRAWDLVELAARTTPEAGPDGLALGCCWLAWSGAIDDHLTALPLAEHDAFTARPAEVLTANTGTTADDHPLARTLANLWQTSQRRMSPDWAVRFRSELIRTFDAMRIEVIQRSTGTVPDFHTHLAARRPSSGTEPFFELAELANGEEIPEYATSLGLTDTDRAWLGRQADILRNWLVGNLDWHCATAHLRYQDHRAPDGGLRIRRSPFAPQPAGV